MLYYTAHAQKNYTPGFSREHCSFVHTVTHLSPVSSLLHLSRESHVFPQKPHEDYEAVYNRLSLSKKKERRREQDPAADQRRELLYTTNERCVCVCVCVCLC